MKLGKLTKLLVVSALSIGMLSGTANAGRAYFGFTLSNTGKNFTTYSLVTNKKTILSDPWTLKVTSISCSGKYGIRFAPAKYSTSQKKVTKVCTSSATWRNGTGYGTIKYASGDAALTTYKLAARQDDSYYNKFSAGGWYNADKYSNN